MFKKCSNFHWFILKDFDFIETVYELFDNPSYLYLQYPMKFDHFSGLQPLWTIWKKRD